MAVCKCIHIEFMLDILDNNFLYISDFFTSYDVYSKTNTNLRG